MLKYVSAHSMHDQATDYGVVQSINIVNELSNGKYPSAQPMRDQATGDEVLHTSLTS